MRQSKRRVRLMALLALLAVLLTSCTGKTQPQTKPELQEEVAAAVTAGTEWLAGEINLAEYSSDNDEAVFLLQRAGELTEAESKAYLESLQAAVEYGSDFEQVTQWQKIAFAVAASQGNPSDQAGLDFLAMTLSYDITDENNYVDLYVLNSKLLASGAFGIAAEDSAAAVEALLAMQNDDGAFADQWGTTVDSTSLSLQALAASGFVEQTGVREAVDKAVAFLSAQQGADGSLSFDGKPSVTSTGQAVAALASLGIDAANDEAFVKDGHSLAETLLSLYQSELAAEDKDFYNMTQGLTGLTAYQRLLVKETAYFGAGMFAAAAGEDKAQSQTAAAAGQPAEAGDAAEAVQPQSAGAATGDEPQAETVTVAITGDEAAILAPVEVALEEGDTAYSVLKRVSREQGIALEVSGSGSKVYVEGIADLYEFDKGASSGWMYRLNGEYPQKSAGGAKLAAGDRVEWIYTLDLGEDVK